jgi:hypothetical protein
VQIDESEAVTNSQVETRLKAAEDGLVTVTESIRELDSRVTGQLGLIASENSEKEEKHQAIAS